jgi:carbon storage regulator
MLVLSRKKNEQILVGKDIRITVVDIRGQRVKLGITAPPEVTVHREELERRMRQPCEEENAAVLDSTA